MTLPSGYYRTAAGSELWISGKNGDAAWVLFDWVEEAGACFECEVDPYPDEDGWLQWHCRYCGSGRAKLIAAPPKAGGAA